MLQFKVHKKTVRFNRFEESLMKFTIRAKLISLIIFIVVVANVLVVLTSTGISRKVVNDSAAVSITNQSYTVSKLVNECMEREFQLLDGLSHLPQITSTEVSLEEKTDILTKVKDMNVAKYNNIGICDVDGKSIVGPFRVMDFSGRDLYKNAKAGKRYASEPSVSSFMPGLWLMYYSVPVMDNGRFGGAVLSVVQGNDLDKIVSEIDIGAGAHPIIIDRKTKTIIGKAERADDEAVVIEADTSTDYGKGMEAVLAGKSGYLTYIDPVTKEQMLASYRPVENSVVEWSVFCAAPASFYLSGLDTIKKKSSVTLLVTIVLSILLSSIVIRMITKPIVNVSKFMEDLAGGNADLTKRINKTSKDEVGRLVTGFNSFTEKMQNIMKDIKQSNQNLDEVGEALDVGTENTEVSIKEIISNITDVHKQIDVQSQSVHETAGAVNEIASNIESLEKMIKTQSDGVVEASEAVKQMIGNINYVNASVDEMASSFGDLTNSARDGSELQSSVNTKIEDIRNQSKTLQEANVAIASIAEQTNLLAMNAAIEAAHAGEAGKGFSVVADEIRKLSETSTAQSKTIGNQLTEIQDSIQNVVDACVLSSHAFETMRLKISSTDEIVKQIKNVMQEQTESSQQIDKALHSMNDSTNEVRVASQEMAIGNKAILEEVGVLQDATAVMKGSMDTMNNNVNRITETGNTLYMISKKMRDSISEIGGQINQFKV